MTAGLDRLELAFDRVDDFLAVQRGASGDDLIAAVERLQEAVGIDAAERRLVGRRLAHLDAADRGGAVLFGMVIALLAAELST
jgi:hypothetical protein